MIIGLLHQDKLVCQTFTVFHGKFHVLVMTESFPIELKVVITQGFSFICSVEALYTLLVSSLVSF